MSRNSDFPIIPAAEFLTIDRTGIGFDSEIYMKERAAKEARANRREADKARRERNEGYYD